MDHKKCNFCKIEKPFDQFHFRRRESKTLDWLCKPCRREYMRKYNRNPYTPAKVARLRRYYEKKKTKNPTEFANMHRKYFLKRTYNMTIEEYHAMAVAQDWRCAICLVHADDLNFRLAVDHNHKTGKIRGLLCRNCNSAIALFRESSLSLLSAIKYLKRYGEALPSE